MVGLALVAGIAAVVAAVAVVGGLGGAVILVPALVIAGWTPQEAAPLGLLSVGAASLAAAPQQLRAGLVHEHAAVWAELPASVAAAAGAAAAAYAPTPVLRLVLAGAALAAAAALIWGSRDATAEPSVATAHGPTVAEQWPLPITARRRRAGLALYGATGLLAGLTGTSGGYLKTPILANVLRLPVHVAAATTTMAVGITAAAALGAFTAAGLVDVRTGAAVVVASLAGGRLGSLVQARSPRGFVRSVLAVLLVAVALVLALELA